MFDFRSFFSIHMFIVNVRNSTPFGFANFFLIDEKASRVLVCFSFFYYWTKWIEETALRFV